MNLLSNIHQKNLLTQDTWFKMTGLAEKSGIISFFNLFGDEHKNMLKKNNKIDRSSFRI